MSPIDDGYPKGSNDDDCQSIKQQCYVALCRYAMEKEKYDASQKQDAPTSPPPSGSDQAHTPASELKQPKKASSGLKRPRTAYILFSMEFRKTLDTGIKFNEGTKLVSCLSTGKENKRKRKSLCREAFQPCLMADGRSWIDHRHPGPVFPYLLHPWGEFVHQINSFLMLRVIQKLRTLSCYIAETGVRIRLFDTKHSQVVSTLQQVAARWQLATGRCIAMGLLLRVLSWVSGRWVLQRFKTISLLVCFELCVCVVPNLAQNSIATDT